MAIWQCWLSANVVQSLKGLQKQCPIYGPLSTMQSILSSKYHKQNFSAYVVYTLIYNKQ